MYRANVKVTRHVNGGFSKKRLISERARAQIWVPRQLERIGPSHPHTASIATEYLTAPSLTSSLSTAQTTDSVQSRDSLALSLHKPKPPMLVFYLESDNGYERSLLTIESNTLAVLSLQILH